MKVIIHENRLRRLIREQLESGVTSPGVTNVMSTCPAVVHLTFSDGREVKLNETHGYPFIYNVEEKGLIIGDLRDSHATLADDYSLDTDYMRSTSGNICGRIFPSSPELPFNLIAIWAREFYPKDNYDYYQPSKKELMDVYMRLDKDFGWLPAGKTAFVYDDRLVFVPDLNKPVTVNSTEDAMRHFYRHDGD